MHTINLEKKGDRPRHKIRGFVKPSSEAPCFGRGLRLRPLRMVIDASKLRQAAILIVDGVVIRNVKGFQIRRTDTGDEILLTIRIQPNEFVEFA